MPSFSAASLAHLATCDIKLQVLFNEVIKVFDCVVIEGHRDKEAQDKAFAEGHSKDAWPTSKHNSSPSKAVDVMPLPLSWTDKQKATYFAGYVVGVAHNIGIKIRWGGDWDGKHDPSHNSFADLGHYELVE